MMQVAEVLNAGISYHQVGQLEQAEVSYLRVLEVVPNQPDALHLLGILQYQSGRLEDGLASIRAAIQQQPGMAPFHNSLGNALLRAEDYAGAIAAYQQAIHLQSSYAEAYFNLGRAYAAQEDWEAAIAAYQSALEQQPSYLNAALALGELQQQQQQWEAALHTYRTILDQEQTAEVWYQIGWIYHQQDNFEQALKAYRQALRIDPNLALACYQSGLIYKNQVDYAAARQVFEQTVKIQPDNPLGWYELAAVQDKLDQPKAAIASYETVLDLLPNNPATLYNLGRLHICTGQSQTGADCLRRAIAVSETPLIDAAFELSRVHRYQSAEDPDFLVLMPFKDQLQSLTPLYQIALHFTLGKAYADIRDFDASFYHYHMGNILKFQETENKISDAKRYRIWAHLKAAVDQSFLNNHQHQGYDSEVPIIIVGMPRSGTTLTEQILASHPQVIGAGEQTLLSEMMAGWQISDAFGFDTDDPSMKHLTPRQRGFRYVQALQAHLRATQPDVDLAGMRITDKMPENFALVGLIPVILPQAKIIHCMRHPIDTCLSCFQQLFADENRWSFDLKALGEFYTGYRQLMAHWRSLLPPGRMLEVQYEDIVADMEGQTRRILDYCDLDWSDQCLTFYNTRRSVQTASNVQVRQPIYKSSVEKWRRYEAHLQPLFEAIAFDPATGQFVD